MNRQMSSGTLEHFDIVRALVTGCPAAHYSAIEVIESNTFSNILKYYLDWIKRQACWKEKGIRPTLMADYANLILTGTYTLAGEATELPTYNFALQMHAAKVTVARQPRGLLPTDGLDLALLWLTGHFRGATAPHDAALEAIARLVLTGLGNHSIERISDIPMIAIWPEIGAAVAAPVDQGDTTNILCRAWQSRGHELPNCT